MTKAKSNVGHVAYPHTPGYLYDCPACESECFCSPAVEQGSETPCIFCSERDGWDYDDGE